MQRIFVFIISIIMFSSCSNISKTSLAIFRTTYYEFERSNNALASSTEVLYRSLDAKLIDASTAQTAMIWQPKAIVCKNLTIGINQYIDSLVKDLKKEAGLKLENGKEIYMEEDKTAVQKLFINDGKGKELYQRLLVYNQKMLSVDNDIMKEFSIVYEDQFKMTTNADFIITYFENTPTVAALVFLKKLESVTSVMENQFANFCHSKVGSVGGCGFTKRIQSIVSQNSNYIKSGDKLEITAGIGSFYVAANPKITINKKIFQSGDIDGFAKYKFKTSDKAGKYFIPVKIEFTDERGIKQEIITNVEYTVVK